MDNRKRNAAWEGAINLANMGKIADYILKISSPKSD